MRASEEEKTAVANSGSALLRCHFLPCYVK
jgi:hypothetical protein